jgi:XTP/dITP diphosphohydrolase
MDIVIATHNRHKLREIRKILGRLPRPVRSLDDFPPFPPVKETGRTLERNALLKARDAVHRTGRVCLADDTGLEVWALGGKPGVYSARYAGPACDYDDNNRKMLRALRGLPASRREAVFRCVVAVARPGKPARFFEGRCRGRIAAEPRGKGGFGYDPIFEVRGTGRTFAQLTLRQKNALSHRARAFRKAARFLRRLAF